MAKVKQKTNRSAKKRFKVTAKGKIKRWRSGGAHYNTKKTPDRKRRLRKSVLVPEEMLDHVRAMLRIS